MKAAATKRLALDASVAVAWCFEDEKTRFAEIVLDMVSSGTVAFAPAIWPLEVANALLVAERRERISTAQVTALLQRISKLPIVVEPIPTSRAFGQILYVAREYALTEYDASYVELASRAAVPLATLDVKLRRAARSAGITLVE
jgi:predicted nucleic acid-binding protein